MRKCAQGVMSFSGVSILLLLNAPFSDCTCGGPSDCGTTPLRGARSDYTTTPGLHDGVYVGTPRPCQAYKAGSTAYAIQLRAGGGTAHLSDGGGIPDSGCPQVDGGAGTCSFLDWNILVSDVTSTLSTQGIYIYQYGNGPHCNASGDPSPFFFLVHDWKDADAAVKVIGQQLSSHQVATTVDLVLGDQQNLCYE